MNLSLEQVSQRIPLGLSLPLFIMVVLSGVLADMFGLASTKAKESALLSMASRRIRGARESVWFVRNASKVSSVLNDMVGDVASALAGGLAVSAMYRIRDLGYVPWKNAAVMASAAVGLVSFLTVTGKALCKPLALRHAESLVLILGKVRYALMRIFGRKR